MGKMRREEKLVQEYLEFKGYNEIIYEPDGNNPPDFRVEGDIAIEVRRLNKHYQSDGNWTAIEELEYKLKSKLLGLFNTYREVEFSNSSFVMIEFKRPLDPSKKLIKEVKKSLDLHLNKIHLSQEIDFGNLKIRLHPTRHKFDSVYVFGSSIDDNTGGHVVSNVYENLKIVIEEKTQKTK